VHPREIFKVAIESSSASIILIHNHPSGNPEPSTEDISITKKIVESGKIMDIPVFDHIIIAGKTFTSFVERRLL
jgi:DNA repair protein RadC